MRYLLLIVVLAFFLLPSVAQDETLTPYEFALQRIEVARRTEAISLYLGHMGLTELPPEIGSLTNLQRLNIVSNELRTLPPEIANLSSLTSLSLSDNQLVSLPPEIGSLGNLERLDLDRNQLSDLAPEIGSLSNLQYLDIGYNQLADLPPEIGNLDSLRTLWIYHNHLTSLVPEIRKLSNLNSLDLRHNQFSSLPPEILELENLCLLILSDNHLRFLPKELARLERLYSRRDCRDYGARLEVEGNPLISPPPEVVAQGTDAIMAYLRNEAWWHLQRLIAGSAGAIGIVIALVLGLRWKNRRGYEKKKKG